MSLPEQFKVTEAEMWQMYLADELKDIISMDHFVLAKRKSDNKPVWVRVSN